MSKPMTEAIDEVMVALMKTDRAEALRRKAIAFGTKAAAKQFAGRKGHGGNPMLAERHYSQHQLAVLLAAAFEAGAELTK